LTLGALGSTETGSGSFIKGDWAIEFDTGSWLTLSSRANPRVFDVPTPGEYELVWTVTLLEHLFAIDEGEAPLASGAGANSRLPDDAWSTVANALQLTRR
jgi:hypothetical protein